MLERWTPGAGIRGHGRAKPQPGGHSTASMARATLKAECGRLPAGLEPTGPAPRSPPGGWAQEGSRQLWCPGWDGAAGAERGAGPRARRRAFSQQAGAEGRSRNWLGTGAGTQGRRAPRGRGRLLRSSPSLVTWSGLGFGELPSPVGPVDSEHLDRIGWAFLSFFFFFFFGLFAFSRAALGSYGGFQESNQSCSRQPTPQQRQIRARSAT